MKNIKKALFTLSVAGFLGSYAHAAHIVDTDNKKAVNGVVWYKKAKVNPIELMNKAIPQDSASVFFIRPFDEDNLQSSANIAINDRFQVSLQPGNYSQVYSCTGLNTISAEITGLKTNNLLMDPKPFTLEADQTYFFLIDVENNQATIEQMTKELALQVLQDKNYQTHQISRVVPNCPIVVEAPIPLIINKLPPEPIEIPKPVPVLQKQVSMELKVLFDNDKAIIKPQYFQEVEDVANFMKEYGNTIAVIEGHTDSNASDSYNQQLSQRRANAVKAMLVNSYGIDSSRLTAIGYGESRPIASNETESGRQQNRRVIAVIKERP